MFFQMSSGANLYRQLDRWLSSLWGILHHYGLASTRRCDSVSSQCTSLQILGALSQFLSRARAHHQGKGSHGPQVYIASSLCSSRSALRPFCVPVLSRAPLSGIGWECCAPMLGPWTGGQVTKTDVWVIYDYREKIPRITW